MDKSENRFYRTKEDFKIVEQNMANTWQPIETAPGDGTYILLGYFPEWGGASYKVAFWHTSHQKWCDVKSLYNAEGPFSPTHWMTLPPPPKNQP
jgi:hypothetical protein